MRAISKDEDEEGKKDTARKLQNKANEEKESFTLITDKSPLNKSIEALAEGEPQNLALESKTSQDFVIVKASSDIEPNQDEMMRSDSLFSRDLFLSRLMKTDFKD